MSGWSLPRSLACGNDIGRLFHAKDNRVFRSSFVWWHDGVRIGPASIWNLFCTIFGSISHQFDTRLVKCRPPPFRLLGSFEEIVQLVINLLCRCRFNHKCEILGVVVQSLKTVLCSTLLHRRFSMKNGWNKYIEILHKDLNLNW